MFVLTVPRRVICPLAELVKVPAPEYVAVGKMCIMLPELYIVPELVMVP